MATWLSNFACEKCGLAGCDCAMKAATEQKTLEVCNVCRRSELRCICLSHTTIKDVRDDTIETREVNHRAPVRPYTEAYLDLKEIEALHFYYQRDAEGLRRWVRRNVA